MILDFRIWFSNKESTVEVKICVEGKTVKLEEVALAVHYDLL